MSKKRPRAPYQWKLNLQIPPENIASDTADNDSAHGPSLGTAANPIYLHHGRSTVAGRCSGWTAAGISQTQSVATRSSTAVAGVADVYDSASDMDDDDQGTFDLDSREREHRKSASSSGSSAKRRRSMHYGREFSSASANVNAGPSGAFLSTQAAQPDPHDEETLESAVDVSGEPSVRREEVCTYEDWVHLKEQFALAEEALDKNQPHTALILLLSVLQECARFMRYSADPSVVFFFPAFLGSAHIHSRDRTFSTSSRSEPMTPMEARMWKAWDRDPRYSEYPEGYDRDEGEEADTEGTENRESGDGGGRKFENEGVESGVSRSAGSRSRSKSSRGRSDSRGRTGKGSGSERSGVRSKTSSKSRSPSPHLDLPTAFHTLLGISLLHTGDLLSSDSSISLTTQLQQNATKYPQDPIPYYIKALEIFEAAELLTSQRLGASSRPSPFPSPYPRTNYTPDRHEYFPRDAAGNNASASAAQAASRVSTTSAVGLGNSAIGLSLSLGLTSSLGSGTGLGVGRKVREDWRLAIAWGRALARLARIKAEGKIIRPLEESDFPQFTLGAHRERSGTRGRGMVSHSKSMSSRVSRGVGTKSSATTPHALLVVTATVNEILVLAADQFSRGIFHMPHAISAGTSKYTNAASDAPFPSYSSTHTSNSRLSAFQRLETLFSIAHDVLAVAKLLSSSFDDKDFGKKEYWTMWADGVISQVELTTSPPPTTASSGGRRHSDSNPFDSPSLLSTISMVMAASGENTSENPYLSQQNEGRMLWSSDFNSGVSENTINADGTVAPINPCLSIRPPITVPTNEPVVDYLFIGNSSSGTLPQAPFSPRRHHSHSHSRRHSSNAPSSSATAHSSTNVSPTAAAPSVASPTSPEEIPVSPLVSGPGLTPLPSPPVPVPDLDEVETQMLRRRVSASRGECWMAIGHARIEEFERNVVARSGSGFGSASASSSASSTGSKMFGVEDDTSRSKPRKYTDEMLTSEDAIDARRALDRAIGYMERALMSPLPSSNPPSPRAYRITRTNTTEKDLLSEISVALHLLLELTPDSAKVSRDQLTKRIKIMENLKAYAGTLSQVRSEAQSTRSEDRGVVMDQSI